MGEITYPASIAVLFVAIGRLQQRANRATRLFFEDRLMLAADAVLRGNVSDRSYPDLPDRIAATTIHQAVVEADGGAAGLVALLVTAGDDLIRKAIANTRRTVRRHHDRRCQVPLDTLKAQDDRAQVDNLLDFTSLAEKASPMHNEVLRRRVRGQDNRQIAAALALQRRHVSVLVHRAINSLRQMIQPANGSDRRNDRKAKNEAALSP